LSFPISNLEILQTASLSGKLLPKRAESASNRCV